MRLRELNATLNRRVTEALSEKRFFADIVDATDASVQVVDHEFRFLAINAAAQRDFERVFGVRPKAGESVLDVLAHLPEEREAARRVWGRVLAGEQTGERRIALKCGLCKLDGSALIKPQPIGHI